MANKPPLDDAEVEITCPNCGHRFVRTVARLRRETPIVCPHCGTPVVHHNGAGSGSASS